MSAAGQIRTRVAVAPQAHEDMRRLGGGAKDAVGDFVHRLRADRTNRALRIKQLRTAGDNGQLSLAVLGGQHMALLLETEENRFTLLAVRHGERAPDRLARLTVAINTVSGAIEVVDQSEVSANVVALREPSSAAGTATTGEGPTGSARDTPTPVPLFGGHDDAALIRLGVVPTLLPALRKITTDAQLAAFLSHNLPELTRDVLLALHGGAEREQVRRNITEQWEADDIDVVDPQDWVRAARRPVSQVSTEDDAVLGALGEGFDAWRLFLHPEQRRLATTGFKGSAKVTGGPGTGKTVVALHRVRHLVDRLPPGHDRPVLLTTYNTNLAEDLRHRLSQLGGEALLRRVDIKSVDRLAREVVEQAPGTDLGRPLDDEAAMNLWHTVRTETGLLQYDADFLDAEFKHVILAQGCGTRHLYMRLSDRRGRPRITRAERADVWTLVEAYRDHLSVSRRTTYAMIADQAARIEQSHAARVEEQAHYKEEMGGLDLIHREASRGMWLTPRYRHVVVDEAQDLSASHWRMLRAMVPSGPDDIFLVGDAHQRIYAHHVILGRLGIETRGRAARRLTLNYRTTREILRSAGGLVTGETFDDLDGGDDSLQGYRSVLTGLAPQFWRAPDWQTEMRAVASLIQERHDTYGTPYRAMAISVPDGTAAAQMAGILARAPFGIPAVELGRDGVRGDRDAVRIGTMYRFKGLEFQRVFLTSVSDGQIPHQRIEQHRFANPDRYRQEEQRARSLVFVAATRARDELVITWNGRPSRFLPEDAARTARNATTLVSPDGPPSGSAAA
ncbi:UvrD-helicase domain-containing protein [Streptomyces sp. NPDC002793]|uniref:UvrD-helicase domain-containing protein n=1 Tax=Streptomyces sp. NPDC002793 TaxID=3154432 RepID=UPI003326E4B6